jgi:hypothetical protein
MTPAVQQLLQAFDALTDTEKHQTVTAVLLRADQLTPPELPEEALVEVADELFRKLDAREAADARP